MVSKFAGASELIKKYEAGIIFDPSDADGSISIIRMLNSQRKLLEKFSLNGERMINEEGLDLINTAKRHIKVYEEVIASSGSH